MENRRARPEHRGVEDHRRIGSALVRSDELDDLVAAGLLLPVAHEADVHGQRGGSQLLRRLEQRPELALVVGHSARMEPAVPHLGLERIGLPLVGRPGRLHVEMPVAEDGRRVAAAGGTNLADDERKRLGLDKLRLAAHSPHRFGDPLGSAPDVVLPFGVGADRRDAEQLQLLHPD